MFNYLLYPSYCFSHLLAWFWIYSCSHSSYLGLNFGWLIGSSFFWSLQSLGFHSCWIQLRIWSHLKRLTQQRFIFLKEFPKAWQQWLISSKSSFQLKKKSRMRFVGFDLLLDLFAEYLQWSNLNNQCSHFLKSQHLKWFYALNLRIGSRWYSHTHFSILMF